MATTLEVLSAAAPTPVTRRRRLAAGAISCLITDGQCPFCSRYVRLVRLRDALGRVELVDARKGGSLVDELRSPALISMKAWS